MKAKLSVLVPIQFGTKARMCTNSLISFKEKGLESFGKLEEFRIVVRELNTATVIINHSCKFIVLDQRILFKLERGMVVITCR